MNNTGTTIAVNNLSKVYRLYNKPTDRLKETLLGKECHKDFYAVDGVSFEVKKGETVGIIGKNGSGKSTLLKMITGVLTPTSGTIELAGKVSALLELGTGFDAELNGIQNIYLNGNMLGIPKAEIEASIPDILAFADIGDHIHQPVKTYSSGMFVRLAFAVAINIKPEILIVDEALSVGDFRFQQKCYRKIREFKENGTVLFVSHDTGAITSFCDRVIWLDDGKIYKSGSPEEIIEEYLTYMRYDVKDLQEYHNQTKVEETVTDGQCSKNGELIESQENEVGEVDSVKKPMIISSTAFGNGKAYFSKVELCNEKGQAVNIVKSGMKLCISMEFDVKQDIEMPILGMTLKDAVGNVLIVTNTVFEKIKMSNLKKGKLYKFVWKFTFPLLRSGRYALDVALAEGTYQYHEQVHYVNDVLIISCVDEHMYQEGRGQIIPNDFSLEIKEKK